LVLVPSLCKLIDDEPEKEKEKEIKEKEKKSDTTSSVDPTEIKLSEEHKMYLLPLSQ
jgi:hypothetical protein